MTVHILLWTGYLIIWLLGTTWLNILGQGPETMLYTLLDLASKVGFGFLSLNTLGTVEQEAACTSPGCWGLKPQPD